MISSYAEVTQNRLATIIWSSTSSIAESRKMDYSFLHCGACEFEKHAKGVPNE